MELFKVVCVDDEYQANGFDQRVESLKRQYRKKPAEAE
jgi:hypothetical protein